MVKPTPSVASIAVRLQKGLEDLVGQSAELPEELRAGPIHAFDDANRTLGYSQLNELLLLLGFDRVSRAFFQFLCDRTTDYKTGTEIASIEDLEQGVRRFREIGLLFFGNVKYAFKLLSRDTDLLNEHLEGLQPLSDEQFHARHEPIRTIRTIDPKETYYLGYVVAAELRARLEKDPLDAEALAQEERRKAIVEIGKRNQVAYLSSDHLDVYVATSMRQRHEFLAVNRLAAAIFKDSALSALKLRWFDPTQAYCLDRIDKGLAEALMLRRAKCTIYFAQESDTLGKDSELASTLAQGKPVIAFVPEVDSDYLETLMSELRSVYPGKTEAELVLDQLELFEPSAAWHDAIVRKWLASPSHISLEDGRARLQRAVKTHYDRRANTLRDSHPLGVQVNLATGVANGVLVVRRISECAELVRRIVTRTLQFTLAEEKGSTVLREVVSQSVFRVATGDQMLSNAFWNFYLQPSE